MKQVISAIADTCVRTLLFSFILFSCKKADQQKNDLSSANDDSRVVLAKVIAQAVTEEPIREFLKAEALKKFGGDYDVVLPFVKDHMLSTGVSFKNRLDAIAGDLKTGKTFDQLIANLPLATILVPETAVFSPSSWNTGATVPIVAIRNEKDIKANRKLIAYRADGTTTELEYKTEPREPVVVLKDNEALQIVKGSSNARATSAGTYSFARAHAPVFVNNGLSYYYADEFYYDPIPPAEDNTGARQIASPPPTSNARIEGGACARPEPWNLMDVRVQEAYNKNIYHPTCPENTATVRDYVYYGIDPTTGVTTGPLNYGYREYLTSIKCDDVNARGRFDDFTEGSIFDFDFIIYTADSDPIFPLKKRLSLDKTYFFTTDADNPTPLKFELNTYPNRMIELAVWNFKRQGDIWKIGVFEYDPGATISTTKSVSSTLGTNFSIGEEKEGGKFGLSATVTVTKSTTITYTDVSDDLGEAVLYWCDPVITSTFLETSNTERWCGLPHLRRPVRTPTTWARTSEITTGIISMTIEPRLKP